MIAQSLSNKGNMKTQRNIKKTDGKKNAKKVQKLTVENGSKKKAVKRKIDFSDGPGRSDKMQKNNNATVTGKQVKQKGKEESKQVNTRNTRSNM